MLKLNPELLMLLVIVTDCVDSLTAVEVNNLPRNDSLSTKNRKQSNYSRFVLRCVWKTLDSRSLPLLPSRFFWNWWNEPGNIRRQLLEMIFLLRRFFVLPNTLVFLCF